MIWYVAIQVEGKPKHRPLSGLVRNEKVVLVGERAREKLLGLMQFWITFLVWNIVTISDTLQWRHNKHYGVSNHQPHDCLVKRLFRRRSKKTAKLRVISLCEGNSSVTGGFTAQRASNAEDVSIWWRHHINWLLKKSRIRLGARQKILTSTQSTTKNASWLIPV